MDDAYAVADYLINRLAERTDTIPDDAYEDECAKAAMAAMIPAMQSLIVANANDLADVYRQMDNEPSAEVIAKASYRFAHAMREERQRRRG